MSLLFYDDSPVFGGHEVMTLLGLEAVLQQDSRLVHFMISAANEKLRDRLKELAKFHPHLRIEELPYQSSKLEALRNRLQPGRVTKLATILKERQPSLVIAVQGNIEHSSLALWAARKAGIPSTSYLPVPHSNAEMGAKLGALRDLFCRRLFTLPDSFITITDEMASMLTAQGAACPVHVVYNGVDTSRFCPRNQKEAREVLGLPLDRKIFGMVGRLEFRQKQQHLLVTAISSDPALRAGCHLVFAGDGPDKIALEGQLEEKGISNTLLPWTDPAGLYPALDALVIPSRYEGLPLVMLEALSTGTAVLASDRDGMKDVLPATWRFQPNQSAALAETIRQFIQNELPAPSPQLVHRVRTEMSLESFGKSFAQTVFSLA